MYKTQGKITEMISTVIQSLEEAITEWSKGFCGIGSKISDMTQTILSFNTLVACMMDETNKGQKQICYSDWICLTWHKGSYRPQSNLKKCIW